MPSAYSKCDGNPVRAPSQFDTGQRNFIAWGAWRVGYGPWQANSPLQVHCKLAANSPASGTSLLPFVVSWQRVYVLIVHSMPEHLWRKNALDKIKLTEKLDVCCQGSYLESLSNKPSLWLRVERNRKKTCGVRFRLAPILVGHQTSYSEVSTWPWTKTLLPKNDTPPINSSA